MDYAGNSGNIDSFSTSGSLYPDDDDFLTPTPPPDPNAITLEERKKIYNELRYQELIAIALELGWNADQINPIREIYRNVNIDDPMDYGRPTKSGLTDDLRKFLRRDKDVKNKLRSKIDKAEVLELCNTAYDTAIRLTIKNVGRLGITNGSAKIRQCAQELRKKICNSVANSLCVRRGLTAGERFMNGAHAASYLGRLGSDPFAEYKPYYSDDY